MNSSIDPEGPPYDPDGLKYTPAPERRMFPMLDGPPIDIATAWDIYRIYSCLYGDNQSLNRIAERGGFGWEEIPHFWKAHARQKERGQCFCK